MNNLVPENAGFPIPNILRIQHRFSHQSHAYVYTFILSKVMSMEDEYFKYHLQLLTNLYPRKFVTQS